MYNITVTYVVDTEDKAKQCIPACVYNDEVCKVTDGTYTFFVKKQ